MPTALLISEQRVKQLTNLDSNVRVEEITPFVIQAGDIYLQPRIGTLLYTRLKEGVIANDLNGDETLLLNDYIGPMLAQYSVYLILPGLKYKLVDKGVLSGTSEETAPTTLDELTFIRNSFMTTAEFYEQRLFEFLCENSSLYPQYQNPGTDGMSPSPDTPYFSGLVIPRPLYNNYYETNCACGNYQNCNCI